MQLCDRLCEIKLNNFMNIIKLGMDVNVIFMISEQKVELFFSVHESGMIN